MKQRIATLALALLAVPSAASANTITDARADLGEETYELRVQAEADLGEPRIRTSPGFVRVWFPGMNSVSLDRDGDGAAIRFVRIRPGYEDTAVTIIRLGDMRRLSADEVVVTRDGPVARISIPRAALPQVAAIAAAETAAPAPVEARQPETASAEASPEPAAEPEAVEAEEEASAPPLALTRSSDAQPLPASDGPSTTVILLVLTLLLGGGYLALRTVQKKIGKAGPRRDIDIIAQKRIGGKHQLLVVRALGEDHLLAVHAGRTEKIASMPAPRGGDEGGGELSEESDLLPFLRLGAGEDEERPQTLHRASSRKKVEDRPRFGAELMKLVGDRGRADSVSLSGGLGGGLGGGAASAPSEAVAGLLRLREKLGR